MNERTYPEGIDCVWLATDRDGRVAAFVTGGAGPIPALVLDDTRSPVDGIEARINKLSPVTSAQLLAKVTRPDDFLAFAERGLYAYDWTDVHRTQSESVHAYELIAVPKSPISARELLPDITTLVAGASLSVSFADEKQIDVSKHVACREIS